MRLPPPLLLLLLVLSTSASLKPRGPPSACTDPACFLVPARTRTRHAPTRRRQVSRRRRLLAAMPALLASGEAKKALAREGDVTRDSGGVLRLGTRAEFLSGLASGTGVSIAKQVVLYPFDTWRTRLQVKTPRRELFKSLYNTGIMPPLLTRTPASAVFFGVKDVVQSELLALGVPPGTATTLAVFIGQFPKWAIRAPAERLKTRSQAAQDSGIAAQIEDVLATVKDPKTLFDGFFSNIAYAFPHDAVKFVAYDSLKRSVLTDALPKGTASIIDGALAGAISELVTSPLDVTRTRVMSGRYPEYKDSPFEIVGNLRLVVADNGIKGLFAGLTPKIIRSLAGGALQFATLDLVKSKTSKML